VALAVLPLGAPFFIAKRGDEAYGEKDGSQRIAVGDLGLGFNAVLVGVFAGTDVGQALVGDGPAAGVVADAQDLRAGAGRGPSGRRRKI
jgi:hypothetical protein